MVGFGSTFRISRRKGWEAAYVDYETLKLLLTQIEAIYEEATALDMKSDEIYFKGLQGFNREQDRRFSSALTNRRKKANKSKRNNVNDWKNELFAESDSSLAYASSYDESEASDEDEDSGKEHSDQFYPSLLNESKYNFSYDSVIPSYGSSGSFGIAPSSASASRESSHHKSRKLSFGMEEHHPILSEKAQIIRSSPVKSGFGNFGRRNKLNSKKSQHQKKINKVPRHIRKAHEKARSITERFLGLLRAEVDKISLFTHTRYGELTDTIGSIRFPTDLEYGFNPDNPLSDGGIHPSASSSSGMSSDDEYEDEATRKMNDTINSRRRRNRTHNSSNLYSEILINALNFRKDEHSQNENQEGFNSSAFRQINLAEELRKSRPIFQRSEQIFGEDFSLLSAVDEADSFAAVGVELLHVLRYVCINVIAIKRLCQKHDFLLSNRMLGGYYHKLGREDKGEIFRNKSVSTQNTPKRNNKGKKSSSSTRYHDFLPPLEYPKNENRYHFLVGVVDSQVLSLCNSSIADTLVNSLMMALSEFEISRERADALATLHKKQTTRDHENSFDSISSLQESRQYQNYPSTKNAGYPSRKSRSEDTNSEDNDDNLSTSSAVSLTRLRFVVASISNLRDAALEGRNFYSEFIKRSLLSMDTEGFIGEPKGLNNCSKNTLDIFATYNPDYALILGPELLQNALEYSNRISNHDVDTSPIYGTGISRMVAISIRTDYHVPKDSSLLQNINLVISVLGIMNYYIIIPSAWSFCSSLGWKPGHSPILIGTMNLSALLVSIGQIYYLRCIIEKHLSYKQLFLISSAFGFVGNILYSKSFEWGSLPLAILARLVVGLSSSEILSKEMVSAYLCGNDIHVFKLRMTQLVGVFLSFLLGSLPCAKKLVELGPLKFQLRFETCPGYILAIFWCLGFIWISLCILRQQSISSKYVEQVVRDHSESIFDYEESKTLLPELSKKDSFSALIEQTFTGSLEESYRDTYLTREVDQTNQPQITELLKRTKKLLKRNAAVPSTLLLYCLSGMVIEVIFTSSTMITNRYFMWSAFSSGTFLVFLSAFIVPVYFVTSYLSQFYCERFMMRKMIHVIIVCLICSINFQALLEIFRDVKNIFENAEPDRPLTTYYDWNYGIAQYILFVPILFSCSVSLDGLSTNLLSKVSSEKINNSIINPSNLAPLALSFGRLIGDSIICLVSFSHRIINTDMINSISFVLIPLCIYPLYVIKKQYFLLQGSSGPR